MNKIKIFLLLSLCLFSFSCFSQNVLRGTVKDSLNNPVPYANVIAQPKDSLKQMQFAITGGQGDYFLELEEIPYIVTASSMGYQSFSFEITPKGNTERNIVLKPQAESLEEVIIEMPVVVKEDTIIYNVSHLMTGEERKLKDVLKKLPGVEVDRDGSITVQGKKVTVLLVEDKKFFGGGTKLGIENIPADAVDQIEVLDDYSEVGFLKELQDSDEMALNVKLKEDKKNFVFGDIEAGKGNQEFYRTHSNLFYYSAKTNLNAIGNLNNIGEQVFTYKQYFDFQGGINQIFKEGNTVFGNPNNDFLQFIEKENVVESERKFGAFNLAQEVNNKLNISGFGIFSSTREETLIESINQYNTFKETSKLSSGTNNIFGIGNIKIEYLPNLTDQWHFETQFKKTNNDYNNNITSIIEAEKNIFFTNEKIEETFFNQVVEWHRKSSKEHTFSFVANYTFNERTPTTLWETSGIILQGLIPVIEEPFYRINQLKKIRNNQFDAILKHYWVINKNNHIYSTIGNTFINQLFFTNDFQELEDGTINEFNGANFGNDLDFGLNDLFLGLHYKFQLGILSFNQGAFLHNYNWRLEQETNLAKDKIIVLPNFSAEAEFTKRKKLKFEYELESSFANASKFADNFYLQSYNSVYRGNSQLENELSHNFKLKYSKFSTYRGFRIYAMVNYVEQVKGIKNTVVYQGLNQSIIPVLLDNPETRWSFFGNLKKEIKDVNFNLGLRHNASEYVQQINETFQNNNTKISSARIAAETLFEDWPIVEVSYKYGLGNYNLGIREQNFVTKEYSVNIDYDFLKGFIASFDFTAYNYKNKTLNQRNQYEIANASLYYNKDSSAWSFEIKAYNLFDVMYKNQNSFTSYVISDTKTYILPRIMMFSIGYKL